MTRAEGADDREPTPQPPETLAGKYRLTSVIGQGGMGTVWRAEHLELGAPVAVKLMNRSAAGSAEALRQCQKEARAAAALRSPHVVQVLDVGMDDASGSPFIVMELLEGESLADRLRKVGKLSPADTTRVLTHVARALSRAHEAGIVHRDLKPANVFLVCNADEELTKVLDFGTARVQPAGTLTGSTTPTGAIVGTPYFMSPEHISGQPVDHRTDLWAMAVMTFECLTGRRPFEARDIGHLVLQICTYPIPVPSTVGPVPPGFDAWFERATRREIDRRFQSARQQADELRRVCDDASPAATRTGAEGGELAHTQELPPPTVPVAPATAVPRRAARWIVAAAVLAVGAAGVAGTRALLGRLAPPAAPVQTATAPSSQSAATVAPAVAPAAPPAAPAAMAAAAAAAPTAGPPGSVVPVTRPTATRDRRTRRVSRHQAKAPRTAALVPAMPAAPPAADEPRMESVLDHRR